jgi:hypothetical protein
MARSEDEMRRNFGWILFLVGFVCLLIAVGFGIAGNDKVGIILLVVGLTVWGIALAEALQ